MTLRLENISKRVGSEMHIDAVTLELEPGGFNVLLGRTLAGKTTLMRLMAGLDRPTLGRVLMAGEDVTHKPVQQRNVAMVYQQFINYPSLSVYDNIASPLRIAGYDRNEIDHRVRESAEMMHIENLLERLPGELSGGQQQRTAMARALVKDADLLLFDEPLANLDYKLREELRVEMREIFRQRQAIAVYATTEPVEALTLSGRIAVLDEGRLLQSGPTVQVYHNPASVKVGEVFSDPPINLISGRLAGGELHLGEDIRVSPQGHLASLAPGEYRFGIRANHLFVEPTGAAVVEVRATVELAEISGSETFIHVRHGGVNVVVQQEGIHELASGAAVIVYLNPGRLFVFDTDGRLVVAPPRADA